MVVAGGEAIFLSSLASTNSEPVNSEKSMALLGLPILLLGAATVYAGYKQYNYTYAGDTLYTVGPAPPENKPGKDAQIAGGLNTQIFLANDALINPMDNGVLGKGRHAGRVRQDVERGANPFSNAAIRGAGINGRGRTKQSLGADLYPQGGRQYVPAMDEKPVTAESMVVPHADQMARDALMGKPRSVVDQNMLPNADAGKPLLYPIPMSSYLVTRQHAPEAWKNVGVMTRVTKKNLHMHERRGNVTHASWVASDTAATDDSPSATNFWDGQPQSRFLTNAFNRRNGAVPNTPQVDFNFGGAMARERPIKLVAQPRIRVV